MNPATIGLIGSAIGMSGSFLGIGSTIFGLVKTTGEHPILTTANTVVRVAVGLNHDPAKNIVIPGKNPEPWDSYTLERANGDPPLLVAFDENGEYLGHSHRHKGHKINDGGHHDMEIHHESVRESVQATWLQVISQNDGICIAYITETWADDTKRSWLGDMGMWCNYEWSFSNIIVGESNHKPYCTWIDNDGSHNSYAKALQIHMEDFKDLDTNYTDTDMLSYCNMPKLLFQDDPKYDWKLFDGGRKAPHWIPYRLLKDNFNLWAGQNKAHVNKDDPLRDAELRCPHTDGSESSKCYKDPPTQIKRRAALKRRQAGHLIVTNDPKHSAILACSSPTFRGPDVFNKQENKMCDLQTRTLWDRPCERDSEMYLGDRICVGDIRPKRSWYHTFSRRAKEPARQYAHVEEWGGAKSNMVVRR